MIHSGSANFAIEGFGTLAPVRELAKRPDRTVFLLPFAGNAQELFREIAEGLEAIDASTLLFLHEIEEFRWEVDEDRWGHYLRETETIAKDVRQVTIIGAESGDKETTEDWLIFSRPVVSTDGKHFSEVEIAFPRTMDLDTNKIGIQPIKGSSRLIVFFPTEVETHLGFLMQGPYLTTPSRDNIKWEAPWNKCLVEETAALLKTALCWFRDNEMLNIDSFLCLPLETQPNFEPLYAATREALRTKRLLPGIDGNYVQAVCALLGSTQAIRRLFTSTQLGSLFGAGQGLTWLSEDLTRGERTRIFRQYLVRELGIHEIGPEAIISALKTNKSFLESQPDEWIIRLYEFFSLQKAMWSDLDDVPFIRLEDGKHTSLREAKQGDIFLPNGKPTRFSTVRESVCTNKTAREFLESLGLRELDLVDDVILNVLPKYQQRPVNIEFSEYEIDIQLILSAFQTDSKQSRHDKLMDCLKEATFVAATDASDGKALWSRAQDLYLAEKDSRILFEGVPGVRFLNEACLIFQNFTHEEGMHKLLTSCGATEHIVDIVMANVLPKYAENSVLVSDAEYEADILRITAAYRTNYRRSRLGSALRDSSLVKAKSADAQNEKFVKPGNVYLASHGLTDLFSGAKDVYLVSDKHPCLQDEEVTKLLEDCGAAPNLRPVQDQTLKNQPSELLRLREQGGGSQTSGRTDSIRDWNLAGLDSLLKLIPNLSPEQQATRARMLWKQLEQVEDKCGKGIFEGMYRWSYYGEYKVPFDAAFVRKLQQTSWILTQDGRLQRPESVEFADLEWSENLFLLSKIKFKPPIIRELAELVGIESEALDLMQKHGITTREHFLSLLAQAGRFALDAPADSTASRSQAPVSRELADVNEAPASTSLNSGTTEFDEFAFSNHSESRASGSRRPTEEISNVEEGTSQGASTYNPPRQFISYIGVHPDKIESGPDKLRREEVMAIEKLALDFILACEPDWQLTPENNPGFDLFKTDGAVTWYCEVKSMTGSLLDRPVGMTHTQFELAQKVSEAFWLYIVENVCSESERRIVRINNPAGRARTFTFDYGWLQVAGVDSD